MAAKADGYKDHRPGSNKGIVHKMFDDKGPDAAIKKAEGLGLKAGTARTWISVWKGGKKKASKPAAKKAVAKKAAKKTVAKTAKKSAASAQAAA